MKNPENAYIEAGYRYEVARTPDAARARAEVIRHLLSTEHPRDHAEARQLVERGRQEARQ